MAFGKQSGPPASNQQLDELLALLKDEGHTDFRDARGPMGFTQRQAGGKFTRDEAQEFIDQLEAAIDERNEATPKGTDRTGSAATDEALQEISTERLAAELRRRGWVVARP